MSLTTITADDHLDLPRGSVAICVPVFGAVDLLAQCLESLLATTPADVPILIADDCSPGGLDVEALVRSVALGPSGSGHHIHFLRQPSNIGFVVNMNTAFRVLGHADVVMVNSDVRVADGWLEGMLTAARSDSRIATVSTLTNHGTIVSVPHRNRPVASLPQEWSLDEAAARVRETSLRLYPRLPTAIGHCALITRDALDLVGDFDLTFSPGYGEEVDFSLRCVARGMAHVLADDVLVFHRGGASFLDAAAKNPVQKAHDVIVCARYPFFENWIREIQVGERSPLGRALAVARRALTRMSVTIDGRCLGPFMTGTQLHALELIGALHQTNQVTLRVILPDDAGSYATAALAKLDNVQTLLAHQMVGAMKTDIVHRPYQVGSATEIYQLEHLGDRVIVTHQDLIAYNAPSYFPNHAAYAHYCEVTRDTFAAADRVLFFSPHARSEAQVAGLIEDGRADVVPLGTDHNMVTTGTEPRAPRGLDPDDDSPMVLCIGTDFQHKNRVFALQVLRALRTDHGWNGRLVFVGPHVLDGSSAGAEAQFRLAHPDVAAAVSDVAAVDEDEKTWLLARAAAVIYPTTFEGFGLVPFESAEAGTPCLFAPVTSLRDFFPDDLALITPWDASATAATLLAVMTDDAQRERLLEGLRAAGAKLRWADTGPRLVAAYDMAIRHPRPLSGDNVLRAIIREQRVDGLEEYLAALGLLDNASTEIVLSAVDLAFAHTNGPVPQEVKRATLAIATRRWLREPIFGLIRLMYRLTGRSRPVSSSREEEGH